VATLAPKGLVTVKAIEKDLPIEQINPVALAEGNSKKPVYQMHKWWARRLGSVFRALILGTFTPAEEAETLWQKFCDGADLQGKIVLDPFMGGGTTVVEALRLGCKVIGVDINPVAWFVTKKEIEPVDLKALEDAFRQLEQTVGQVIKRYYRTCCPKGHEAEVMYFFWVKVAECQRCGARVRLFPNYELSKRNHTYVCICRRCLQIITTSSYSPKTQCPECGEVFDPKKGVAGRGFFQCPFCGERQKVLDAIQRKGTQLETELHGLEGFCDLCGRFFKRVDEADIALWQEAKTEFERRKEHLLFPRQAIPIEGRSDPRPVNHGYTHFYHMFNERQLLCLSLLLDAILRLPDPNIREFLLLAFSDALDANNMFCKYEVEWHKVSVFFGLHAYHPIERPTENNVWGTVYGRGSFIKCCEKVIKAKRYCQQPYERLRDLHGKRFSKTTGAEKIEGRLVGSFDELLGTERAALLRCQSAEDLSFLPDGSVDAVITDPPYFDNLQYSELADFFYVWLRLGLKDDYAWFEPEYSNHPRELVQNEKLGKTTEFFREGIGRVFAECYRVLKDDGLMVFTFHHAKAWAWAALADALLKAGFYVAKSHIVRSEGKSGFHSSEGNIRYDAVLVCRKQPVPRVDRDKRTLLTCVLEEATECLERTVRSGMQVSDMDVFTIVMAKTLEHGTKGKRSTGDGQRTLTELFEQMASLVGEVSKQVKRLVAHETVQRNTQLVLVLREAQKRWQGA
jgi:adenine-specific DNA methylase